MNRFRYISLLLCMAVVEMCAQPSLLDLPYLVRNDSVVGRFSHGVEFDFRPGYIFPTHDFFKGDNDGNRPIRRHLSFHAKYGFQLPQNSQAVAAYTRSEQGVGVSYNTFGESASIGNPIAFYAFQSARILSITPLVSFDYEWNFGLSSGWNPYNPRTNEKNHIIGTKTNAYINATFNLNWKLSRNVNLLTGVSLTHFSNGNTGVPNYGLNTVAFNLGVAYKFGRDRAVESMVEVPSFPRHLSCDVVLFGSFRRTSDDVGSYVAISPERYAVAGFNINPMYDVNYRFRAGLSLDGVLDRGAGVVADDMVVELGGTSEQTFMQPKASDQLTLGLSARAEYVMPFFSINAGIGYNLYAGQEDQSGLYQIYALIMSLNRNLVLHVGYSLRDFNAPNYLMLGVGFRLHNKTPRLR